MRRDRAYSIGAGALGYVHRSIGSDRNARGIGYTARDNANHGRPSRLQRRLRSWRDGPKQDDDNCGSDDGEAKPYNP
jgi:hypothetical protein